MDLHIGKFHNRLRVYKFEHTALARFFSGFAARRSMSALLGSIALTGLHLASPATAGDFTLDWGGVHNWPGGATNPALFNMFDQYGFQLDAQASSARINSVWIVGAPTQSGSFGTVTTILHAVTPNAGNSAIGESTVTATLGFSSNGNAFGVDNLSFQITDIDATDGNSATFNGDRCDFITATGNAGNPALSYISPTPATRSVFIGPGAGAGSTGAIAANQAQCIFNTSTAVGSPISNADDNGSILATYPTGTSSVTITYEESIENVSGLSTPNAGGRGAGIWGAVAIVVDQSISLVKTADISSYSALGQVITYTYTITNDGPLPINTGQNILISDDQLGEFTCGTISAQIASGGTHSCTNTHTITAGDMTAPSVINIATAGVGTGVQSFATRLQSNSDTQTVVREIPAMSLTKSAAAPTTAAGISATLTDGGDTIAYTYTLNNTGNVELTSVTITDVGPSFNGTAGSGSLSAFSPVSATIPASGSQVFTATYTLSQADVDNAASISNAVTNSATANGTAPSSASVASNVSTATTTIGGGPSFTIAKSVDLANIDMPSTLTYTMLVTNTGNVTLTSPVLTDVLMQGTATRTLTSGPTLTPATDTDSDGELDVGEIWEYIATYNVPQGNINNGRDLDNTATFDATEVTPASDNTITTITQNPELTLTKLADTASVNAVGDVITYSIKLENTGNISIRNITVSDPLLSSISCTPGSGPNPNNMGPGRVRTCTGTYTVTQSDFDNNGGGDGDIDNTATVDADWRGPLPPFTQTVDETVDIIVSPSLVVTKAADDATEVVFGQLITYTYTVNNNGNQTISNLSLSDLHNGSGTAPAPANEILSIDNNPLGDSSDGSLDGIWDSLAPGDTVTFSTTYQVTQNDVDTKQ